MIHKTLIELSSSLAVIAIVAGCQVLSTTPPNETLGVKKTQTPAIAMISRRANLHFIRDFEGEHPLDFSPDSKLLATGGGDYGGARYTGGIGGFIQIWQVASGKLLHTLRGHNDVVYSAIFSPNGKVLASGSRDKTIRLWDVSSGRLLHTLVGHKADVIALSFSPDGRLLASGSRDNTIRLWDVRTGKARRVLGSHNRSVYSVAFSHDGKSLASGSWDGIIKLWSLEKGKSLWAQSEKRPIYEIAFSSDGKLLISVLQNTTIHLWRTDTGKFYRTLTVNPTWMSLDSADLSSNGQFLARCSSVPQLLGGGTAKGEVDVIDVRSGRIVSKLVKSNGELFSPVLSSRGRLLAVGVSDSSQDVTKLYLYQASQKRIDNSSE